MSVAPFSKHAWKTALTIDNEISALLKEHGLVRKEGRSKMTEAIARMVQLAINRDYELAHDALLKSHQQCVLLLEKYGPEHGMPEDIELALAEAKKLQGNA